MIKKILKTYFLSFLSTKNKAIINITVQANTDNVFKGVVSAPQTSKNKAPIITKVIVKGDQYKNILNNNLELNIYESDLEETGIQYN